MKILGIESTITQIDEAYINAAFSVLKNIYDCVDAAQEYPLWDAPAVKEKYAYEVGEFYKYIVETLNLFQESDEGKTFINGYEISEAEYAMFDKMKSMTRDILAIVNPTEQVDFFYNHLVSRINLKKAYIASSAELFIVLNGLTDVIKLVDQNGNPIDPNTVKEEVPETEVKSEEAAPESMPLPQGMDIGALGNMFAGLFAGGGMPMPGMMPPMPEATPVSEENVETVEEAPVVEVEVPEENEEPKSEE